jgi:hypothetical protein
MADLTTLFTRLGWTREDRKWLYLQVVGAATLIVTNTTNLPAWFAFIGVHATPVDIHRLEMLAAVILAIAGHFRTSPLFAVNPPVPVPVSKGLTS